MLVAQNWRGGRRLALIGALSAALLLGAACNDDGDATPTPTATPTAEGTAPQGTQTPTETPTPIMTETPTPTPAVTETATPAAEDACADLSPVAAEASFVFVANVTSGDTLASGTTVEGCSRTFESNVTWHLEDRNGDTIADGFTMGGGVDGHATYEFDVEYEVDEAQIGHLVVEAPDPSGGEGFPPVTNRIPVVLTP